MSYIGGTPNVNNMDNTEERILFGCSFLWKGKGFMIKEEFLEIMIYRQNIKHYLELGYDCIVGEKITVHYSHVQKTAKISIQAICDYCGCEKQVKLIIFHRLKIYNPNKIIRND